MGAWRGLAVASAESRSGGGDNARVASSLHRQNAIKLRRVEKAALEHELRIGFLSSPTPSRSQPPGYPCRDSAHVATAVLLRFEQNHGTVDGPPRYHPRTACAAPSSIPAGSSDAESPFHCDDRHHHVELEWPASAATQIVVSQPITGNRPGSPSRETDGFILPGNNRGTRWTAGSEDLADARPRAMLSRRRSLRPWTQLHRQSRIAPEYASNVPYLRHAGGSDSCGGRAQAPVNGSNSESQAVYSLRPH